MADKYVDMAVALGAILFIATLVWIGALAVRYAKKGTPGAQVLGAVFLLFGMGNIRDPSNEIVQQAKQLKRREEDDSGDPPATEKRMDATGEEGRA